MAALSACLLSIVAAEVISVDCGVVGTGECARLKALSVPIVTTADKSTIKSTNKSYLIAAAIASVATIVCILTIVGLTIYTRKRLARKREESVITEHRSYEWDTTAVNTPTSSFCDKTEHAYEEVVWFRLDVPPHSS
ncbi:hypothetical protein FBU31_003283 [Coemansia sp. 'formosensis']|nr:hypothetical protein FBU31_003283 [Coemansia sp. 'formosensis']